jgi:hypothetical protein
MSDDARFCACLALAAIVVFGGALPWLMFELGAAPF